MGDSRPGDGADPDIDLGSRWKEIGERIGLLVEALGTEASVRAAGKSARQLDRYTKGAEPPFGVVLALVEASGASIGWIVTGQPETMFDYDRDLVFLDRERVELQREERGEADPERRRKLGALIGINSDRVALNRQARRILADLMPEYGEDAPAMARAAALGGSDVRQGQRQGQGAGDRVRAARHSVDQAAATCGWRPPAGLRQALVSLAYEDRLSDDDLALLLDALSQSFPSAAGD